MADPVIIITGNNPVAGGVTTRNFAGALYRWLLYTVTADAGPLNVVLDGAVGMGGVKDYTPSNADFAPLATITMPGVYKQYVLPTQLRFRVITGTNVIIRVQQRTDAVPEGSTSIGGVGGGGSGTAPTIVEFLPGITVVVGNLTNYNHALYPVTVAHTFGIAFDATKHGSPVATPGSGVINRLAWTPLTLYNTGELVSNGGQTYSALNTFTSGAAFNPANWNLQAAMGGAGIAGLTAYQIAVNGGFVGTQVQWLASLQGAPSTVPGPVATLGLLEAGTALFKGNAYFRLGAVWQPLTPASHEKAEGVTGVVDRYGNVIADGNPVDVTGLGYLDASTYYVEYADAGGKTFAVTPNPLTPALMPTPARSFLSMGTAINVAGKMILAYRMQANIDPSAAYSANKTTVFTDLTYNVTPTLTQINRLIDTAGIDLTKNKLIADGDVDASAGFLEASPITRVIGGVSKTVFLQDVGTGGLHVRIPQGWEAMGAGDYLFTVAQQDNDNIGGGPVWGASATALHRVAFYGGTGLVDYYVLNSVTVSGNVPTETTLAQLNFNSAGANKLRYFHTRMNISADRKTITFKTWGRNVAKPHERQAEDEPAVAQFSYVSAAAFPVGGVGWSFGNGYSRRVMASYSPDPAVKAPFVTV